MARLRPDAERRCRRRRPTGAHRRGEARAQLSVSHRHPRPWKRAAGTSWRDGLRARPAAPQGPCRRRSSAGARDRRRRLERCFDPVLRALDRAGRSPRAAALPGLLQRLVSVLRQRRARRTRRLRSGTARRHRLELGAAALRQGTTSTPRGRPPLLPDLRLDRDEDPIRAASSRDPLRSSLPGVARATAFPELRAGSRGPVIRPTQAQFGHALAGRREPRRPTDPPARDR